MPAMRTLHRALALSAVLTPVLAAQTAGSFEQVGSTRVSAMMMFLGNEEKVYIMDKVEGNKDQINGHPAWASVWDIKSKSATLMDFQSNAFCASGMHFPNGSFATFGGNSIINAADGTSYADTDGAKSIRILNPCTGDISASNTKCQWYDDASKIAMDKKRWYSTAEPLADGSIVLIGGFVNGGYINRNWPNVNPDSGAAENSYEFYPARDGGAQPMEFMRKTSGLSSYAHAFLMPSGNMFVQANVSTIMWDYNTGLETPLPDMPNNVARVYPASGAVAMLPLTPANNYTPTILFCGGTNMTDDEWGNYANPWIDTWDKPASNDCQRITPEPTDGSAPAYVQDDDMLEGRTMGQFIILPDGKLLVVNGGINGTAGYSTQTQTTPSYADMPFGMSLASGPVGTPAIYDPNAPAGSRWSNEGLASSNIPRLYHSTALLLPDASVMIAGSNPNVDVNLTTTFPTEYRAEIFYPPYFSASTRPAPTGIPATISYGGDPFDLTLPASSYSGVANDAADKTTVVLIRPGWTTHAMNMGQRFLQLNNTYSVNEDASITLHVAQAPPIPELLTPGPALLFVVVDGIPSVGKMVQVGNGKIGKQPKAPASVLPASERRDIVSGSASSGAPGATGAPSSGSSSSSGGGSSHTGAIAGGVVGGLALLAILGAIAGIFLVRRRRARRAQTGVAAGSAYAMGEAPTPGFAAFADKDYGTPNSSTFMPLRPNDSSASVGAYRDSFNRDSENGTPQPTPGFPTQHRT